MTFYSGNSSGWALAYISIMSIFLISLLTASSLSGVMVSIFFRFSSRSSCHAKYSSRQVIISAFRLLRAFFALFVSRSYIFKGNLTCKAFVSSSSISFSTVTPCDTTINYFGIKRNKINYFSNNLLTTIVYYDKLYMNAGRKRPGPRSCAAMLASGIRWGKEAGRLRKEERVWTAEERLKKWLMRLRLLIR